MKRFFKSVGLTTMFIVAFALCMFVVGAVVSICMPNLPADISFMLLYFCSMFTIYGATLLIERAAFKRVLPVYNSRRGFNPVSLLLGVVLIISISIVLLPLEGVLSPDSRAFGDGPCTLIAVVVLAPIFEEMIFRARLYNILSRNTSPLMSASLSAIAFGVVHMEPIVVVEALVVGVVLSYYYLSKRSIFAPVILHMFNNAIGYLLIVMSYRGESLRSIVSSGEMQLAVYLVATAIVVCSAVVILRFFVKEKRRMRGVECQDMETLAEHHDPDQLAK
jgi:membrane protease YdiL (CAAX protease family)